MDASSEELSSADSDIEDIAINIDKKYVEKAFAMIMEEKNDEKKHKIEKAHSKSGSKARRECILEQLSAIGVIPPGDFSPVVNEMNAFIARHDFDSAARCLYNLLLNKQAMHMYRPLLWKVASVILLNHPNMTVDFAEQFLQMNCGIRNPDAMRSFLQQLLRLPKSIDDNFRDAKITKNVNVDLSDDTDSDGTSK